MTELRDKKRTGPTPMHRALGLPALALGIAALPGNASAAALNLAPEPALVALNVVLFVLLIYPVNKLLVQPLLRVLDERERRTAGAESEVSDLQGAAREARATLEAGLVEARARAQARRAAILSAGEADERAVLDGARSEAAQAVEGVRASVQAELSAARAALESDTRALAREAATRILGRPL